MQYDGKTIPDLLFGSAQKFGSRRALCVNGGEGSLVEITYSGLSDRVVKLSSFIQRTGIENGSHIALIGVNSPTWATIYLAIQTAGCVVVPLDATLHGSEIRHIVRHSDAEAIFCQAKYVPLLLEDDNEFFKVFPHIIFEDIDEIVDNETMPLPPRIPKDTNSLASIIYTSGTTGSPKGAMLSHANIVMDIAGMVPKFPFSEKDVFLSVLPLHHAFECTAGFLTPVSMGASVCYSRSLRAKDILEDITASGTTVMLGVPLLFEKFHAGILKAVEKKGTISRSVFGSMIGITKFLDSIFKKRAGTGLMRPFRKKAGFCDMWLMISGGAAIKPETVKFFNHFGIIFAQGYGLTETSPVLSVNPPDKIKPASVGPALIGVGLKIEEPDENGVGEIIARGQNVFKGYYKNPTATSKVLVGDGWFKTGDIGFIDSDGYLFITGRAKNVIVTAGGKNVYPEELEELLNQSEYILESLVICIKHGNVEAPFAIIVPDFDFIDAKYCGNIHDEEIERIVRETVEGINKSVAPYKRLTGFKIQSEEFPKTSTRKIKRYLFTGREIKL
jgi:long-chain acyl-CoA synthetase